MGDGGGPVFISTSERLAGAVDVIVVTNIVKLFHPQVDSLSWNNKEFINKHETVEEAGYEDDVQKLKSQSLWNLDH